MCRWSLASNTLPWTFSLLLLTKAVLDHASFYLRDSTFSEEQGTKPRSKRLHFLGESSLGKSQVSNSGKDKPEGGLTWVLLPESQVCPPPSLTPSADPGVTESPEALGEGKSTGTQKDNKLPLPRLGEYLTNPFCASPSNPNFPLCSLLPQVWE